MPSCQLYMFENFYSKAYPECAVRMNSIQALLDRTAQEDPDAIREIVPDLAEDYVSYYVLW
jgi:hypothetical protein